MNKLFKYCLLILMFIVAATSLKAQMPHIYKGSPGYNSKLRGLASLDSVPVGDASGYVLVYDSASGVIKKVLAPLLSGGTPYLNVKGFGALGNGVANDGPAILACNAAALAIGWNVYFPPGTYNVTTFLNPNLTNIMWFGHDSLSVIKGNLDSLLVPTAFKNSVLQHLTWTTTKVSSSQSFKGLITVTGIDMINNTIQFCNFTNPRSNSDAISIVAVPSDSTLAPHLIQGNNFIYNRFYRIGRLAMSIFNRKFSLSAHAYVMGNHFDHNYVDSTGTQGSFGMAISYDGAGQGNTASYNEIHNMLSAGIEMQAHYGSQIVGNHIYYETRSFPPIAVNAQPYTTSAYGIVVAENVSYGANTYWNFFNMQNSHVYGNTAYAAMNTSANDGTFFLVGSSYNTFENNYISGSTAAIKVMSQPAGGTYFNLPSTQNIFINNFIVGTPGLSSRALVSFDSTLTTYNYVTGNNMFKGNDSSYFRSFAGAANNFTYGNFQDSIYNPYPTATGVTSITFTNGIIQDVTAGAVNAQLDTSAANTHPSTQGYVDRAILAKPKDTNQVQNTDRDLYTGYKILFVSNSGDTLRAILIDSVGDDIQIYKDSTSPGRQRLRIGLAKGGTPTTNSLGTNVTSATVTAGGKDHWFQLTVVTSGNVNGTVCNFSFGKAFSATPVAISPGLGADAATAAATTKTWVNATSTTSASFGATITGAGTYLFNFQFNNP